MALYLAYSSGLSQIELRRFHNDFACPAYTAVLLAGLNEYLTLKKLGSNDEQFSLIFRPDSFLETSKKAI